MNMKNLDKIIKNILILTWVGLSCSILRAEVVITELFILQADGTHTPQYVELYNNSDTTVSLENWSIHILDSIGDTINPLFAPVFDGNNCIVNNTVMDAFGYFLISTKCNYNGCGPIAFTRRTSIIY